MPILSDDICSKSNFATFRNVRCRIKVHKQNKGPRSNIYVWRRDAEVDMVDEYHFGVVWGWKLVSSLVERWVGAGK